MKLLVVAVVAVVALFALGEGRRHKRSARLSFRASPKMAVDGATEELVLNCKPPSSLTDVFLGVLTIIERTNENGTEQVATQRAESSVLVDNNRTTAEGYTQDDEDDEPSFLKITIAYPTFSDEGVYTCKYIYIDTSYEPFTLAAEVNVTVVAVPPPDYVHESTGGSCGCEEELEQLRAMIASGSGGSGSGSGSCHASFSARFPKKNLNPILGNQPAVFEEVLTNKGDGYNPSTGEFVAPCDGQYFFTLTLRSVQSLDSGHVSGLLMVGDMEVARTNVLITQPIDNFQSATNGAVVTLEKGQKVHVYIVTSSSGEFTGTSYSVFSGFYLSP